MGGAAARDRAVVDREKHHGHAAHRGRNPRYEDNVLDLLLENLGRLQRGETELKNGVV